MSLSVVCVLLMGVTAVLTDGLHGLSKRSVSDDDCFVARLEFRLNRIEEQLDRIEEKILTCDSSEINDNHNCTVDLASYGYDDSPKLGYVRTSGGSSEQTYHPDNPLKNRGVILFELDLTTCTTKNRTRFDTWANETDRKRLLETLEAADNNTIIIGVTADSPENNNKLLQSTVGDFFNDYNMDLSGFNMRDKFCFVIEIGYPKKTVFQRKTHDEGILEMKVAVEGTTPDDLTFKLLKRPRGTPWMNDRFDVPVFDNIKHSKVDE